MQYIQCVYIKALKLCKGYPNVDMFLLCWFRIWHWVLCCERMWSNWDFVFQEVYLLLGKQWEFLYCMCSVATVGECPVIQLKPCKCCSWHCHNTVFFPVLFHFLTGRVGSSIKWLSMVFWNLWQKKSSISFKWINRVLGDGAFLASVHWICLDPRVTVYTALYMSRNLYSDWNTAMYQ